MCLCKLFPNHTLIARLLQLALLLEKCELATATLGMGQEPPSTSFNAEVEAFVAQLQATGKPVMSDEPEVDALVGFDSANRGDYHRRGTSRQPVSPLAIKRSVAP